MRILEEVAGAKTIGISGHVRPDGDCVGSCLSMKAYLEKTMPGTEVVCYLEKPAAIFSCIKGYEDIRNEAEPEKVYDAFIVLDATPERTGFAECMYQAAKKKINIDHHISNEGGSDADYIVPEASSASELVFDVIDKEYLDADIAKAIYIGIIHDTGVLQYSNTSPKALRTVAELIAYEFDHTQLIDETFYEKTYIQNKLLGHALVDSILLLDGKVAASRTTLAMLNEYGANGKDLEGIVNQLRLTKGAECAVFMYEMEPGVFKVSLRCTSSLDVAKVAGVFDGGGHVRAAGCTMSGTFEEILEKLTKEIAKQM